MFVGGSAGSTAGGIKVMRTLILTKIARNQVLSTLYPNRIMTIHINEQPLDKEIQHGVLKYLTLYVFLLRTNLTLSLDNNNFMVVVSAATSTFNNIGPMLGTSQTFAIFSPFSKLLMSFAMIAGRLKSTQCYYFSFQKHGQNINTQKEESLAFLFLYDNLYCVEA